MLIPHMYRFVHYGLNTEKWWSRIIWCFIAWMSRKKLSQFPGWSTRKEIMVTSWGKDGKQTSIGPFCKGWWEHSILCKESQITRHGSPAAWSETLFLIFIYIHSYALKMNICYVNCNCVLPSWIPTKPSNFPWFSVPVLCKETKEVQKSGAKLGLIC